MIQSKNQLKHRESVESNSNGIRDKVVADIYPFIHRQVEDTEPPEVDGRLVARIREEAGFTRARGKGRATQGRSMQLKDGITKVGRVRQKRTKKCRNPG